MKKRVSIFCGFLVFLSATAGLSGCSDTKSTEGAGQRFVNYQEIAKEYADSVSKLKWPEGFTPPSKLEGEDPSTTYQSGYGDTVASFAYQCAWEREWLKNYATNKERAQKAIKALEKIPSMGFMSTERADDNTRNLFNDCLNKARLGDPSGFQEDVKLNCPDEE